jgi:hypothetical protein
MTNKKTTKPEKATTASAIRNVSMSYTPSNWLLPPGKRTHPVEAGEEREGVCSSGPGPLDES